MDMPRGSCGVEVMTPGVVATEAILYQEANRGPTTPRAAFGKAPYTSGAAFGPPIGRVGYDHRMEVRLKEGGPEGEGGQTSWSR